MVCFFACEKQPSEGWLFCDGSVVLKDNYSLLFDAISNNFLPVPTNNNSFRLPDLRGCFIRGFNNTGNGYGGINRYKFESDTFKKHEHIYYQISDKDVQGFDGTPNDQNMVLGWIDGVATTQEQTPNVTETKPINVTLYPYIRFR
jgi:microcystin-dependent protein